MKRLFLRFGVPAAIVAVGLFMMGCEKEKNSEVSSRIHFSAISTDLEETRTSFVSGGGTAKQRISWSSDDQMKIWMLVGETNQYGVYKVSSSDRIDRGNENVSRAEIEFVSGTDLMWPESGAATFYAAYPATALVSKDKMEGTISNAQTETVDMSQAYMFAHHSGTTRQDSLNLRFHPVFTTFDIQMTNPGTSSLTITSLTLSSEATGEVSATYLAGSFELATSTREITVKTGGQTSITVTPSSPLTIDSGGTATLSILALPVSQTNLSLSIAFSDSNIGTRTLPLKSGSTFMSFDPYKKHVLSNLNLPALISGTGPAIDWNEYIFTVENPSDLSYAGGTSSTGKIISYKTNDGGNTTTALSWEVFGYYASAEAARNATEGNNSVTLKSLMTAFTPSSTSGSSTGEAVSITYSGGSPTVVSTGIVTEINNVLKGNQYGDATHPINLTYPSGATWAEKTSSTIYNSANCYIVNGWGWFKIPLVMGCSWKEGSVVSNDKVYKGNTANNTKKFPNYNSTENSNTKLKDIGTPSTAHVVWEDVDGLINGLTTGYQLADAISSDKEWLYFNIPQNKVAQGNAVISVKDQNNNVMWSYHIWVTTYTPESDVYVKNSSNKEYHFMPIYLGWVIEGGSVAKYPSASVFVRLNQKDGGNIVNSAVMEVTRPANVFASGITTGHSPSYQWGRKDPMPHGVTVYGSSSSWTTSTISKFDYYNTSIKNPEVLYTNGSAGPWWAKSGWTSIYAYNLWSAENTATNPDNLTVVKTIFDPCPAGYSVMAGNALVGGAVVNSSNASTLEYVQINSSYKLYLPIWYYYSYTGGWANNHGLIWTVAPNGNTNSYAYKYNFNDSSRTFSYNGGISIADAASILPMRNNN